MNVVTKRHELAEVISITNFKGGVGKTTTVQSISACLHRINPKLRILMIDLDPQCNLSILEGWQGMEKEFREAGVKSPTIFDSMSNGSGLHCYECSNGLWIVPGSTKMIRIDNYLQEQMQPKMVLAKCFRKPVIYSQIENDGSVTFNDGDLTEVFDYIFIDCPPALSDSTYNAMGVATSLLIPVPTESLALTALGAIIEQYKAVKDDLNPELVIRGILPVMIDERPNIARMVIQVLKQQYGDVFIPKKIRRCIKVNESQMQKKDIYEYSPYCTAALDYEVVTKYLFNIK